MIVNINPYSHILIGITRFYPHALTKMYIVVEHNICHDRVPRNVIVGYSHKILILEEKGALDVHKQSTRL